MKKKPLPIQARNTMLGILILIIGSLEAWGQDDAYTEPKAALKTEEKQPTPVHTYRSYTNNTYGRNYTAETDNNLVEYYTKAAQKASSRSVGTSTARYFVPYYAQQKGTTKTDSSLMAYYKKRAQTAAARYQRPIKETQTTPPVSSGPQYIVVKNQQSPTVVYPQWDPYWGPRGWRSRYHWRNGSYWYPNYWHPRPWRGNRWCNTPRQDNRRRHKDRSSNTRPTRRGARPDRSR